MADYSYITIEFPHPCRKHNHVIHVGGARSIRAGRAGDTQLV